jgi:endonuclease G
MRRALLVALVVAIPGLAHAQVIGGAPSPSGKWPDALAVFFGAQQECTGVLIAPTLALTAGHCADPSLDHVLVGANDLTQPAQGESITVMKQVVYPNSQQSIDETLLILATPAKTMPRTIASGWARFDIANGAQVAIVGWGATDANASNYPSAQQEAMTTITDFDCTTSSGCNAAAKPDGELGAGGMGVDTCPGDSGGPLYLVTSYGTFLAGTTSRSYDNATTYCKDGGIYERPDKVMDWIEQQSGVTLPRGPSPSADTLEAQTGRPATEMIVTNDPHTDATHTFAITTMPMHGGAMVDASGAITYTSMPGYLGADSVAVSVTDAKDPTRTLPVTVAIDVTPDMGGGGGGGCGCTSSRPTASGLAPLGAIAFVMLRRRRARR